MRTKQQKDQAYKVLLDGERQIPSQRNCPTTGYSTGELIRCKKLLTLLLSFTTRRYQSADYLALTEALRKSKEFKRASVLLEEAKLRHPTSKDIYVQLARIYLDAGHPRKAAMVGANNSPTSRVGH